MIEIVMRPLICRAAEQEPKAVSCAPKHFAQKEQAA